MKAFDKVNGSAPSIATATELHQRVAQLARPRLELHLTPQGMDWQDAPSGRSENALPVTELMVQLTKAQHQLRTAGRMTGIVKDQSRQR